MRPLAILALLGSAVGVVGLTIDFVIIMGAPGPAPSGAVRSLPETLVYFWSFFTHLANLGVLLVYLARISRWRGISSLLHPVFRASMAGNIALVMIYFHFMLAPLYEFTGGLLIANYLLHYIAPLLYLVWWTLADHGSLRFRDIPTMLLPGLIYAGIVLVRGAMVGEYPYALLDPGPAGYGAVAIGVGVLLGAVALFCAVLAALDRMLASRTLSVGPTHA